MRILLFLLVFAFLAPSTLQAREWTDSSGDYRIEAKLVLVHGTNVVLERPDGKIISIPLAKLSEKDQAYLNELETKPNAKPSEMKAVEPTLKSTEMADASPKELAERTEVLLRDACHRCHGEDGTSEGGFNFVVNLAKLSKTIAEPGTDSLLLDRIHAEDDSVMPPVDEEPRLSPRDIQVIEQWIAAGAPTFDDEPSRPFVTNEQIIEWIDEDLQRQAERSQRFMRYFTLTHLYNAGVSEDELQAYRNAFAKLLNSLSWNADLIIPEAIDPARTVFRLDIRKVHWTQAIWRSIEDANPYFLRLSTPHALSCFERTQTKMPFVRVDWFVFAASKPPLYHSVLNLPSTDADLEHMLRVNVQANINQEMAIRAAFNRSGVSQNNRLIEWHKSPYGSYWKSYDFASNTGFQNLFEYPLGPNQGRNSFRHDGGEIIFTLPNGLQGYLLTDEKGQRIDQGPTQIVSDPKQPDRTVTNGVSCMSCHYAGMIPKRDEVGPAVQANRSAFDDADDILALYRQANELDQIIDRDAKRFADALDELGITTISRSGESVSAMAARFIQDIDLQQVACEFGLQADEFLNRLKDASRVARVFSSLQISGGTIKRDVFKELFSDACVDLRLIEAHEADRSETTLSPSPHLSNVPPQSSLRANNSASRDMSSSERYRPAASNARTPGSANPSHELPTNLVAKARFTDLRWGIKSLAFSPNTRLLAGGRPDRAITLFDIQHQNIVAEQTKLEILQAVTACIFTPDGSRLIAGGQTGHISVFTVSPEGLMRPVGQFAGHTKEVKCIEVSRSGRWAISGGAGKVARCWEVETGREVAMIGGFQGALKAVHISDDEKTLLATDGHRLITTDVSTGQTISERPLNRSWSSGQSAAFSADGAWLAVGDSYNVRVWDLKTFRELMPLIGNEILWSMRFTSDSRCLITGGSAKIDVWDFQRNARLHRFPVGRGYVQSLAVSKDGTGVAAVGSIGSDLEVFLREE
ncbi:SHD1 domain-containing protein [Rhodopirellula sp. P2]|uniref:SHD1 domain-containing protein n=1 Tax=Rhodopirellula sp. P2 TaxID=2127060 RepID=UPI0023689471|nr:SHD1 domain-containing protein [Rhodopirellula sp. P2]WDQ16324.1 SHD1 domain-containing protein [Rhodopirellula sp. P2]